MASKTYSEKLRDPRWQRKRLEVLNRDDFTCQSCGDTESTLHVHHLKYERGREPWDYDIAVLVTLCEQCHEEETQLYSREQDTLLKALAEHRFLTGELSELAIAIHEMKPFHIPEVMASVLAWAMRSPDVLNGLCEQYFKYLKRRQEKG